jgi:hypothetical protein
MICREYAVEVRYHVGTRTGQTSPINYATEHGIKGAVMRFGPDRKRLCAWRRRWQAAGLAGLVPRYPPIRHAALRSRSGVI